MRFRHFGAVVTAEADAATLDIPLAANAFAYGQLRWLEGANTGITADVVANTANRLSLTRPPHFPVTPGTKVELIEGCDKRLETCATRFGNAINFRGEPHLPGNDLLTRYPGAG